MEFGWSEQEQAFRERAREFVAQHWRGPGPHDVDGDDSDFWERSRAFERAMAAEGWLTMHWPREYGGQGASVMEQMIFAEEAAAEHTPEGLIGSGWFGPMLMIHGSEQQKREHLPRIARAETVWCTGLTEPSAGSDLASLKTRAWRDGDHYVLEGQKMWAFGAHRADWMHVLVRTDPEAPKHRGISYFMVEMSSPGVSVRPLLPMSGTHTFNEVFFEQARVPAANRIGEENRGWYAATTTLDFERSGIRRVSTAQGNLERLIKLARVGDTPGAGQPLARPSARERLAEAAIEIEVARYLSYRVTWLQAQGLVPNYEASMAKAFGSEVKQRLSRMGVNVLGQAGALKPGSPYAPLHGEPVQTYLWETEATIGGGTSEIQRNIIAQRGLGLPRG